MLIPKEYLAGETFVTVRLPRVDQIAIEDFLESLRRGEVYIRDFGLDDSGVYPVGSVAEFEAAQLYNAKMRVIEFLRRVVP